MLVDLLGRSRDAVPTPVRRPAGCASSTSPSRWPTACPASRSRVVVSEGTLTTLSDAEIAAILSHEHAHLRARHDLVLEMFTAVHAAFPRFVRSANALDAVRLLIELLADDAAVRAAGPTPAGPGPGRVRRRAHPVGRAGRGRSDHRDAGAPPRRQAQQSLPWPSAAYVAAAAVLVVPTVALAVPWLTELHRLFSHWARCPEPAAI